MKYCLALDVSKGKSMVIFMSEYGEVLLGPKEYHHNDESLNQLYNEINGLSNCYTVIMESTGTEAEIMLGTSNTELRMVYKGNQ